MHNQLIYFHAFYVSSVVGEADTTGTVASPYWLREQWGGQSKLQYCFWQLKAGKLPNSLFTGNKLTNMKTICSDLQGSRSDVWLIWHNEADPNPTSTVPVAESVFVHRLYWIYQMNWQSGQ